jgi:uncharacterized protein with PIN domain
MKRKKARRPAAKASSNGGDLAGEGPVCPHCRQEITWENLESSETEISIYVREKMYFCPKCRAILGIASWHTEG